MKNFRILPALFFASIFLFSACRNTIGYSVLLWNVPEKNLPDGIIVPVYLKSNISKVYVIGIPESGEKIEVPLWKISEPASKSRAQKNQAKFAQFGEKYAACVLDGLPIRSESLNTSSQVYRLRKNEIVKVLYSGKGVAPENGGVPLAGEWLFVLTKDGTKGWCFSYNLRVFKMNADGTYERSGAENEVKEKDETLDLLLAQKWYPDYYRSMISKKQIDLEFFTADYGFDTGFHSGTIKISLPGVNANFPYTEFEKQISGEYKVKDAPLEIFVRNQKFIVVKYTDSSGKPKSYNFISLDDDIKIEEQISSEKERRIRAYKSLQSLGPDFKSGNYGTISFNDGNLFRWTGFKKLVPNVIPQQAKGNGIVEIKYFAEGNLKSSWDGILTMHFESAPAEINFLYKKEANGIRLSFANVFFKTDEISGLKTPVVSLPANSIVLFFQN